MLRLPAAPAAAAARCTAAEPQQQPLPGRVQEASGRSFARLLLVRQLREEKLLAAAQAFVAERLGAEFTEPEPWTLDDVFEDTSAATPIVFVLSAGARGRKRSALHPGEPGGDDRHMYACMRACCCAGADPTAMLQRFGERKGWLMGQRLHLVSLGQGQGLLAETIVKQAAAAGDWVCLQNCHLAASWMRRLEEKVRGLQVCS